MSEQPKVTPGDFRFTPATYVNSGRIEQLMGEVWCYAGDIVWPRNNDIGDILVNRPALLARVHNAEGLNAELTGCLEECLKRWGKFYDEAKSQPAKAWTKRAVEAVAKARGCTPEEWWDGENLWPANGAGMPNEHTARVQALEAENARLREALTETVLLVEDQLFSRLRAELEAHSEWCDMMTGTGDANNQWNHRVTSMMKKESDLFDQPRAVIRKANDLLDEPVYVWDGEKAVVWEEKES